MRYIIFILLLSISGCKTHRKAELNTNIRQQYELEYLSSGNYRLEISDTIHRWTENKLSGQIIVWSAPDSFGRQHKVADIDFQSETQKKEGGISHTSAAGITSSQLDISGEDKTIINIKEEKQTDINMISHVIIIGIIIIVGIISLRWIMHKKIFK